ncbi:MAG: hypothetical protein M1823_001621 [Watsoniomyces obsoletus]|nr:MAG: hypothetical protein M1823_001621 [Watsoniomyces obsoletus]
MSEAIRQLMMRPNVASLMQRTYDECYLTCSTAVYYESQNNEVEALRSWRSALDHIYFHNAYNVPPGYRPKTETERALMESLRDMERQCKERVDTWEAIRRSRVDEGRITTDGESSSSGGRSSGERVSSKESEMLSKEKPKPKPKPPPLPQRPPVVKVTKGSTDEVPKTQKTSSGSKGNGSSSSSWGFFGSMMPPPTRTPPVTASSKSVPPTPTPPTTSSKSMAPPPSPYLVKKVSRSPSPEKRTGLLTTLRNGKGAERASRSPRPVGARKESGPAAAKAATQAWGSLSRSWDGGSSTTVNSIKKEVDNDGEDGQGKGSKAGVQRTPPDVISAQDRTKMKREPENGAEPTSSRRKPQKASEPIASPSFGRSSATPIPPQRQDTRQFNTNQEMNLPIRPRRASPGRDKARSQGIARRPLANTSTPRGNRFGQPIRARGQSSSEDEPRQTPQLVLDDSITTNAHPPPHQHHQRGQSPSTLAWNDRVQHLLKNLPRGVDEQAAKQILNEIVVKGDEVHWEDVAGLDIAKNALKEAVVYPFLRPDLFMGLREPARGMLLFGPPGTGKTMLARAVATESRSTFFSISASSLTSKYLGESEKLVRALFQLAKALAPSIIFVDEIDSLLSARSGGGGEHEATRRIKTEFLIQWSDLARAAAGRETPAIDDDDDSGGGNERGGEKGRGKVIGDATRVLVLAATNLPWEIDEAARRRFVRRQYIPLPEGDVRAKQLRTLLGHQKHCLTDRDIEKLVELTDGGYCFFGITSFGIVQSEANFILNGKGFSGSDITYLAKDAAMGPLRSLGEALLQMSKEDIRSISLEDFEASLITIRPSVSKKGLKSYEDWAREFGERA